MSDIKTIQKLDVFISSPSMRDRYVLIPLAYEKIVPAEIGDKPQKVVDKYMRESSKVELFIDVLWSRMGTPLVDEDGTAYYAVL